MSRASAATEGSRRPLPRSKTPFDRRRTFGGPNSFQTAADVLRINVDALVTAYDKAINVTNEMMKGGKANTALSYFGVLYYGDLLHGGAYLCPINERPYFKGQIQGGKFLPGGTPYDPPDIQNLPSQGLLDWIGGLFAGSAGKPSALYDEVLVNANCPHVFPKLLSDESWGLTKLSLAYLGGTEFLKSAGTGINTLVEAETKLVRENVAAASQGVETLGRLLPLLSLLGAGA